MKTIDDVLNDPATSNWLKAVLQSALLRDPVDAANDASMLAKLLDENARAMVAAQLLKIRGGMPSKS